MPQRLTLYAEESLDLAHRLRTGLSRFDVPEKDPQQDVPVPTAAHGYSNNKDAHRKRMARIEGQVRGISRMVEEDTYCIDVLPQISAINKALEAVALKLLDEHLHHCVVDAVATGGPGAQVKLKEASDAIARLVRS